MNPSTIQARIVVDELIRGGVRDVVLCPGSRNAPLRGFKAQTWEGGIHVPMLAQWKGTLPAGKVYEQPVIQLDFLPTALAAAGMQANAEWKLDGVNLLPFLKGEQEKSPREGFLYWSDDGELLAIRVGDWKAHFFEQRGEGIGVWREMFSELRFPKLFNLRADPFESDTSLLYDKWNADRMFMLVPAQVIVAKWLESFKQFPIRQRPASFNLDSVMQSLMPHS